jgi:hypothetical protein
MKCLPMALCRWPPEIAIGKLFADGIFFFADGFGPSANKPDPVVLQVILIFLSVKASLV